MTYVCDVLADWMTWLLVDEICGLLDIEVLVCLFMALLGC